MRTYRQKLNTHVTYLVDKRCCVMGKKKKGKQKQAVKMFNRKNLVIISICVVIAVVIGALIIFNTGQQSGTRVFTAGSQTVTLRDDGTFSAQLAHSVAKSGTYTESVADNITTISFTYNGKTEKGSIVNNVLTLPHEWDDGHGHGTKFTLKNN